MTLSHTLAWYEFRVVGIAAAFAGIITLIHNLPRTWPGEQGVTDHQHLGLYLTTVVLNGFGVVAHSTGMKPKHWNVPFFLSGTCISVLLYYHDPESHGLHKNLHQVCSLAWLAAMVARTMGKGVIAGMAASIAGCTFASVIYAHIWMIETSYTNYLGYFFYTTSFVVSVYGFIVSVIGCAYKLGVEKGKGEPTVNAVAKNNNQRGKYERIDRVENGNSDAEGTGTDASKMNDNELKTLEMLEQYRDNLEISVKDDGSDADEF